MKISRQLKANLISTIVFLFVLASSALAQMNRIYTFDEVKSILNAPGYSNRSQAYNFGLYFRIGEQVGTEKYPINPQAAIFCFEKCFAMQPDWNTVEQLCLVYGELLGDYNKVLEWCQKGLIVSPTAQVGIFFTMGKAYHRLNRLPEAEEILLKAVELDDTADYVSYSLLALGELGDLYHYSLEDYDNAIKYRRLELMAESAEGLNTEQTIEKLHQSLDCWYAANRSAYKHITLDEYRRRFYDDRLDNPQVKYPAKTTFVFGRTYYAPSDESPEIQESTLWISDRLTKWGYEKFALNNPQHEYYTVDFFTQSSDTALDYYLLQRKLEETGLAVLAKFWLTTFLPSGKYKSVYYSDDPSREPKEDFVIFFQREVEYYLSQNE